MKKFGFLIFLLAVIIGAASASVYKDKSGNFYCLKDSSISRSQDGGNTWTSSKLVTSEAWLDEDIANNLYLFFKAGNSLFMSRSKDHGLSFEDAQLIYNFASSPESLSIGFSNDNLQLIFHSGKNLYYAYSTDAGRSFAPAQALNNDLPVSQFSGTVFLSNNSIYYLAQERGWTLPAEIYRTQGRILSIAGKKDTIAWTERSKEGEYALYNWDGKAANLIYKDNYPILDLNIATPEVITFSLFRENRYLPHYLVNNLGFGLPKPIKGTVLSNEQFQGLLSYDDGITGIWTIGSDLRSVKLSNSVPSAPKLSLNNAKTNGKLKLTVSSDDPDRDPLVYKIDIGLGKDFDKTKCWTFTTATTEVEIPLSFPDDKYYIRARASDFISTGPYSDPAVFYLDRQPPKIIVTQPEWGAIVNTPDLEIKGQVSEECSLTVNSEKVSVNRSIFSTSIRLKHGDNQIVICATDEAGNSTVESFSVTLNENAPALTLLNPSSTNWYKSGASIIVEAKVKDPENDILDEADAPVMIDGQAIGQTATFNLDENKITGLITLPADLSEGEHKLNISIYDSKHNLGSCSAAIKVDSSAPEALTKNIVIAKDGIEIPFKEDGSGIDAFGTVISIKNASIEVAGKIKKEGKNLIFVPDKTLAKGNYEIKVTPRDLIGNVGKESSLTMKFDSDLSSLSAQLNGSSVEIEECQNGPNPFSPLSGQTTAILYKLTRTANLKFYLFTLDGEQILSRSIPSTVSGKIIWDGRDAGGGSMSSGVYVYALVAQDSTERSAIKRGKIILLQ